MKIDIFFHNVRKLASFDMITKKFVLATLRTRFIFLSPLRTWPSYIFEKVRFCRNIPNLHEFACVNLSKFGQENNSKKPKILRKTAKNTYLGKKKICKNELIKILGALFIRFLYLKAFNLHGNVHFNEIIRILISPEEG